MYRKENRVTYPSASVCAQTGRILLIALCDNPGRDDSIILAQMHVYDIDIIFVAQCIDSIDAAHIDAIYI